MSHLLSTVNPEAAAKLQAEGDAGVKTPVITEPSGKQLTDAAKPYVPQKPLPMVQPREITYACDRIPKVGEIVTYHARPGQGRAGKSQFPAMIMHCDPRGVAELSVFFSADDISQFITIPYATEERPFPAWSFIEIAAIEELRGQLEAFASILERMHGRVNELEQRVSTLEARKVDLSPITKRLAALEVAAKKRAGTADEG